MMGVVSTLLVAATSGACITRPISAQSPTTKTSFTASIAQAAVDKVDILFAIDNSGSMGDKQELLAAAVPDLVRRLITPDCIDSNDGTTVVGTSESDPSTGEAKCPAGSEPEFPAVHDLHLGIVSSSLGGRGSSACDPTAKDGNPQLDDHGHLLNRTSAAGGAAIGNASPSNFLAWLPEVEANHDAPRDPSAVGATVYGAAARGKFDQDFSDLIVGVGEVGCGYEAQLESVYRFLIQPDPYLTVVRAEAPASPYQGIDADLLRQRHDFLRPDSLVAIIMITDENESDVAPTAFKGHSTEYEDGTQVFPGTPACKDNPDSAECMSCLLRQSDNSLLKGCDGTRLAPDDDNVNVRFFDMKRRFGVDPRFPVERYVRGFKTATVPDRNHEYGASPTSPYVGNEDANAECTNPLFASSLPTDPNADLCHLPRGTRPLSNVYFTIIGGVPWQLLTTTPQDLSANYQGRTFKSSLDGADWTALLGAHPEHFDVTGQNPLMQESIEKRPGVGADQVHDREWDTQRKDLQYACTFELPTPRDCTPDSTRNSCDCHDPTDSPLCNPDNPKEQLRGKAYPTPYPLAVAKGLGDQGIVASICPPDPKNRDLEGKPNPFYGYRPAVRAIVDRLKNGLASQCLPEALSPDSDGRVPCQVLELVEDASADCASLGLSPVDARAASTLRDQKRAELGSIVDTSTVCEAQQILPSDFVGDSCELTDKVGWCYLTGKASGAKCANPQSIKFSKSGNPVHALVLLQCIKESSDSDAGTAP